LATETAQAVIEHHPKLQLYGRAVFLISGGIDSPVAAWLLIRKGVDPVFAYFDNYPLCDQAAVEIALEAIRQVCTKAQTEDKRVYVIAHSPDVQDILSKCPVKFACILSRRMMLRVAEAIAIKEKCNAIVTGDAIGQKASQTVENLMAADCVLGQVPVIRPLVGMNKVQIVKYAKLIGTYAISTRPGVASCGVPTNNPSTSAKRKRLDEIEQALDVQSMVERAIAKARVLTV
jgi:thiamine biosynthesis protein ThiI